MVYDSTGSLLKNIQSEGSTSFTQLQRSIQAGCTNESLTKDLESLTLNFGLFVANQDRFQDASEILEPVALGSVLTQAGEDANRLWEYCRKRCEEQLEQ